MRIASDLSDATAAAFPVDRISPETVETATFGMGCFWSSEGRFGAVPGVVRTRVGFAGGSEPPVEDDYKDHTEVVQVDYDPNWLDYRDLLDVFWEGHDPTTETERKLRSVLFVHDDDQRTRAENAVARTSEAADTDVYTDVEPFETLYLAPHEHQKYYLRGDADLVSRFDDVYSPAQFVNSTAAARLNAVVGGYGSADSVRDSETESAPTL